jgi:hypothetical protein
MNSKRIQLLWTVGSVWISLLLLITTTYSANIVIGGNYTDISTIVIVSPKPGDPPLVNGTALLNVLAGIDADFSNPFLIKLGPGIYALGATGLQMKEYVSIEGSGEKATKITAPASGIAYPPTAATVMGANNAELRFLTVENTATGNYTVAILNTSASPSLIHVTATVSGGTYNYGMYNTALDGSYTILIDRCSFSGNTYSIKNHANFTLYIGASKLGGPILIEGGITCSASYDGNYLPICS